jgi:cyclophilin family peptidyl-prolyl cis-trans isomerase
MKHVIAVFLTLAWAVVPLTYADAAQSQAPQRGAGTPAPSGQRAGAPAGRATAAQKPAGAGPVIVFETVKGSFEIQTYPSESPKTVEYIVALVKKNFYNGLRVHRVVPGFVMQFGDPLTRDMTRKALWGTGGSGREIGVAEISPKRPHRVGAAALAHRGDPRGADSQIYIALAGLESPQIRNIEGKYTVFGQVVSGMDVVQKLQVPDVIRRATVK